MAELLFSQVDKKSGLSRGEGSGVLEEEKAVQVSPGGKKDKLVFSTLLCLSHIRHFFSYLCIVMTTIFMTNFFKPRANDYTTKQFILLKGMFFLKLCSNDYIITMYLAWGHISPSQQEPCD